MKTYTFNNLSFKRYTRDESRTGDVQLTIDWMKLAYALGKKAAFNKSGKSGLQIGIRARFFPK